MALKELTAKAGNWLKSRKFSLIDDYKPQLDADDLLAAENQIRRDHDDHQSKNTAVVVQPIENQGNYSIEKLQEGFTKLVDQLGNINTNLDRQVSHQQELMTHLEKMPKMLETFPALVENQKVLTSHLFEQLKTSSIKDQQFIDAVEKIPTETAKQTDALENINHQLGAAADADVQLSECFNKFNTILKKLDGTTNSNTDGINQMSKTFATSDRYLKYLISKQNKRFMWMFVTAVTVCVFTVTTLAAVIIYLKQ